MVSKQEAYRILGLNSGATFKEVEKKYKELALEWYPQKHNYSALSNQKFKDISQAYVLLSKQDYKKEDNMAMSEMLDIFQKVFLGNDDVLSKHDLDSDNSYDDVMTDEDDDGDDDYSESDCSLDYDRGPTILERIVGVMAAEAKSSAKAQTAAQNAKELIADEEKEKRKAEKRKAKKKRRKLKKKLEKDEASKKNNEESGLPNRDNDSASASEVEAEGLDPNCAFVAVSASKSKVLSQIQAKKYIKTTCTNGSDKNETEIVLDINPQVLQAREIAIRGNMMANIGEFQCAIGLFIDAIKLDPTEFKYFCNRSYCYHQLNQFDRALKDAEKGIALQPTWPKGYFRKGQALTGLERYAEADVCFRKVLALDKNCSEAIQELKRTQTYQLMEMGFTQDQSEQALDEHVNLQEAAEALLSGSFPAPSFNSSSNGHQQHQQQQQPDSDDEIYMSDEDDRLHSPAPSFTKAATSTTGPSVSRTVTNGAPRTVAYLATPSKGQVAAISRAGGDDFKMDARNPEGKTSLWVGNIKSQVTEKMLLNLFSRYGELASIRLLPDRRCAFINYKDKRAAGKAMESLQGYECFGENLLIRFPDKAHAFGQSFVIKKKGSKCEKTTKAEVKKARPETKTPRPEVKEKKEKMKGPVNGDECYFWRTTGCSYGSSCRYRHVKQHEAIDKY